MGFLVGKKAESLHGATKRVLRIAPRRVVRPEVQKPTYCAAREDSIAWLQSDGLVALMREMNTQFVNRIQTKAH